MLTIIPRSASPEPPRKRQKTAKSVRFAEFVKIVDYVPDKYEYIEDGDENEKAVALEVTESAQATKDFDFLSMHLMILCKIMNDARVKKVSKISVYNEIERGPFTDEARAELVVFLRNKVHDIIGSLNADKRFDTRTGYAVLSGDLPSVKAVAEILDAM